MKTDVSLEEFLKSCVQSGNANAEDWKNREPVAFHLDPEYKAKYDQLQEATRRQFGKTMVQLFKASIDKTIEILKAS